MPDLKGPSTHGSVYSDKKCMDILIYYIAIGRFDCTSTCYSFADLGSDRTNPTALVEEAMDEPSGWLGSPGLGNLKCTHGGAKRQGNAKPK